jgi:hypothetical protein
MSSLRACRGDLPLFCRQQFAPGWRLPSRRKDPVVSLQNRLPGRQSPWLRLGPFRRGVGRQAERGLLGLRARLDDACEARADVLGVAAHHRVVELEAIA